MFPKEGSNSIDESNMTRNCFRLFWFRTAKIVFYFKIALSFNKKSPTTFVIED
jgi:hypothetical protein